MARATTSLPRCINPQHKSRSGAVQEIHSAIPTQQHIDCKQLPVERPPCVWKGKCPYYIWVEGNHENRKNTRLNSSHVRNSYPVISFKKNAHLPAGLVKVPANSQ